MIKRLEYASKSVKKTPGDFFSSMKTVCEYSIYVVDTLDEHAGLLNDIKRGLSNLRIEDLCGEDDFSPYIVEDMLFELKFVEPKMSLNYEKSIYERKMKNIKIKEERRKHEKRLQKLLWGANKIIAIVQFFSFLFLTNFSLPSIAEPEVQAAIILLLQFAKSM